MNPDSNPGHRSVVIAAEMALKTGDVQHILEWIPEEYEKKMKNLFEKTLCEKRLGKDRQDSTVDWYFKTACQLYDATDHSHNTFRKK